MGMSIVCWNDIFEFYPSELEEFCKDQPVLLYGSQKDLS